MSTTTACPECNYDYEMDLGKWFLFSFIALWVLFTLFFSILRVPPIGKDNTVSEEVGKNMKKHLKNINVCLFLISLGGVGLFTWLETTKRKKCSSCSANFPISKNQMIMIILLFVAPITIILLMFIDPLWKNKVIQTKLKSSSSTLDFIKAQTKLSVINFVLIVLVIILVLFILYGFYIPKLSWDKGPKENFFFEVSPQRAKCLEEQVSRKNFGKPRSCSCCGRGTVGGIPPNYDQWLNIDQDTGSRWHRPDNVSYVQTFSNGEEATCNNCGPPSYKMYV